MVAGECQENHPHDNKRRYDQMKKEEWFKQHAGRYRLVKFVIGENDCSEAYVNGWKDK